MEQRIKAIRKAQNLTQTEFGARIGVKGNTITGYETGLRTPSDAIIMSICREFNISERWLRTGAGEMQPKRSGREDLAAFIGDVLSQESDFRFQLLLRLSQLTPEEWRLLEKILGNIDNKKTGP